MNILVTYDVNLTGEDGQRRLRKVAKACQNYGRRVQNSVFECQVTEAQLVQFKACLLKLIDREVDSIRIYNLGNNLNNCMTSLGKETGYDVNSTLII